jgi:hypothetical protein
MSAEFEPRMRALAAHLGCDLDQIMIRAMGGENYFECGCNVALAQALSEWLKRTTAPAHPEHAQCAAGCSCPSWPGGGPTQ